MSFFKIPKGIAEQVGQIEYQPGKGIDLTACPLVNNKYAIDEETIDLIKANEAAIMAYLPPNLQARIKVIIDLDKQTGERATKEQINADMVPRNGV